MPGFCDEHNHFGRKMKAEKYTITCLHNCTRYLAILRLAHLVLAIFCHSSLQKHFNSATPAGHLLCSALFRSHNRYFNWILGHSKTLIWFEAIPLLIWKGALGCGLAKIHLRCLSLRFCVKIGTGIKYSPMTDVNSHQIFLAS